LVNVNQRWSHDRVDQVHYAFFNGVGYEPWEQVWGVWNGITPRDGELIRRFATLTRGVAPYLQSEDWEPYFPTVQSGVFASYWPSAGSAVWTLVNRNAFPLEGSMLSVPAVPGMRYFDLYHGEELIPRAAGDKVTLSFPIDGRGIGAVLATPGRADAGMTVLMATMRLLTAQPLDAFDDRWKPLAQALLQPAATKRYASAPEGMVAVPTARFEFAVQGVEIEDDNGYVDVQYPWEDQPRRSHRHVLDIPAFFIDRYPVSNGEFKRFVVSTSYTPKDSGNFLKGWADTEFPSGAENKPVTWVSQDDARAYCTWAGKRLPREWEWQYSAQGTDGRIYPWGNDWQADRVPTPDTGHEPRLPDDRNAHPNGASPFGVEDLVGNVWQWTDEFQDRHTRAAILRGGSLYKPQGSYWYFPQAYRNDQHGKLLLMAPSKDRSSMIGFRCAADSAR
jgi:formylglycine-generating enzyme required for sulfatase activity